MNIQKTRFCPSPTGALHLGNLRAALFSFLLSRKKKGKFLLRIEDTDTVRSEKGFVDNIYSDLEWLELFWDEGPKVEGKDSPYFQSERTTIYESFYKILLDKNLIYPCFTSEEELKVIRRNQLQAGEPPRYPGTWSQASQDEIQLEIDKGNTPVYRFRMPEENQIDFNDLIKGNQSFNAIDLDDFIVKKTDGTPSFMFANAVDDALMGVTYVVRGEDHLSNTPRQLALLNALELSTPEFAHLPLFFGHDGSPLSKRNGSLSILDLRERGYLPSAILNYLARVGHLNNDNNIKTLDELGEFLDMSSISSSPSKFDLDQLKFWQKQAVESLNISEMLIWLQPIIEDIIPQDIDIRNFITLINENIVFPEDAIYLSHAFFSKQKDYSEEALVYLSSTPLNFFDLAEKCIDLSWGEWAVAMKNLGIESNTKGKNLYMPIRVALSGLTSGPELDQIVSFLGKDEVIKRFNEAKKAL